MKKLILLAIPVLLLTGCEVEAVNRELDKQYMQGTSSFDIYVDRKTCVEYLIYNSNRAGGITPRLNTDGTIVVNQSCLEVEE